MALKATWSFCSKRTQGTQGTQGTQEWDLFKIPWGLAGSLLGESLHRSHGFFCDARVLSCLNCYIFGVTEKF